MPAAKRSIGCFSFWCSLCLSSAALIWPLPVVRHLGRLHVRLDRVAQDDAHEQAEEGDVGRVQALHELQGVPRDEESDEESRGFPLKS